VHAPPAPLCVKPVTSSPLPCSEWELGSVKLATLAPSLTHLKLTSSLPREPLKGIASMVTGCTLHSFATNGVLLPDALAALAAMGTLENLECTLVGESEAARAGVVRGPAPSTPAVWGMAPHDAGWSAGTISHGHNGGWGSACSPGAMHVMGSHHHGVGRVDPHVPCGLSGMACCAVGGVSNGGSGELPKALHRRCAIATGLSVVEEAEGADIVGVCGAPAVGGRRGAWNDWLAQVAVHLGAMHSLRTVRLCIYPFASHAAQAVSLGPHASGPVLSLLARLPQIQYFALELRVWGQGEVWAPPPRGHPRILEGLTQLTGVTLRVGSCSAAAVLVLLPMLAGHLPVTALRISFSENCGPHERLAISMLASDLAVQHYAKELQIIIDT